MLDTVVLLILLPALAVCTSDGNIHLMEEEVAVALRACSHPTDNTHTKEVNRERQRLLKHLSYVSTKVDDNADYANRYGQVQRSSKAFNVKGSHYIRNRNNIEKLLTSATSSGIIGNDNRNTSAGRSIAKRNDSLLNKTNSDQCLSQCVFANLQVVDTRGIPREAELWNKVQSSVTSQQSRSALRDQIRACFQELQSEAEDDGCSYSNKVERCLMLRFSDRKIEQGATQKPTVTE